MLMSTVISLFYVKGILLSAQKVDWDVAIMTADTSKLKDTEEPCLKISIFPCPVIVMNLNSFRFIVLFPQLFLLYYVIPAKYDRWRNIYLILVSYLLYINRKQAYALIHLGVTAITYFCSRSFEVVKKLKAALLGGNINIVATFGI